MEPERMLCRPEPAEVSIKVVAEIIATSEHKDADESGEVDSLVAVIMVDDEVIDDSAHGSSHPKWAEQ